MKLLFLFFLIPLFFLTAGFSNFNDIGYQSLDDRPDKGKLQLNFNRELLKDATVSGEIRSNFNNLRIVGIRFEVFSRINDDFLEFRIKESGAEDWYYTARYKTDQFQPDRIFPIGFPEINDARGKNYYFELQSINGTPRNAVAVSEQFPSVIGRHVFTKKMLREDPTLAIYFLKEKIINLIDYPGFLEAFLIYSLPLVIILIFQLTNFSLLLGTAFISLALYWNIFVGKDFSDYFIFSVLFAWWLMTRKHKLSGIISGLIPLILFSTVIFFTFSRSYQIIEKTTYWAVLFLLFTFIQQAGELFKKQYEARGIEYLWQRIFFEIKMFFKLSDLSVREATLVSKMFFKLSDHSVREAMLVSNRSAATFSKFLVRISPLLPIIFIIWLVKNLIREVYRAILAYQNYFPSNQTIYFLSYTGIYLIILYIMTIAVFMYLKKKYQITNMKLLIILILLSTSFFQSRVIKAKDFSGPVVWSVKGWGLKEAWVDIFVEGRNFRDAPYLGKIFIDGVEQRVIRWSNEEIIFRTNPLTTKSGKLTVVREEGQASNTVDFYYLYQSK